MDGLFWNGWFGGTTMFGNIQMAPDPVDGFQLRLVGSWLLWHFLKYENL